MSLSFDISILLVRIIPYNRENPNGIPNNLMPYITQVAVGKRAELGVFAMIILPTTEQA
jgi:hypothetical protein